MTSVSHLDEWPLPAFKLNSKLAIMERSEEAKKLVGDRVFFLELLDEGSRKKAREFLSGNQSAGPLELNFISLADELFLGDVYSKWDSDSNLNIVLVPKDNRLLEITSQLLSLRTRLQETDYDLLLEKERTEDLLEQVRKLSAPCIDLGKKHILIPLFGDLDPRKIEVIRFQILNQVYETGAETVIMDLTAMDQLEQDGVDYLKSLMQTFKVMGIQGIMTGMKPQHAKQLHHLELGLGLYFVSSLQTVLASRKLLL
ncbi:STAS domain-containing protein [Planococcus sp. CPCC 101016]|uniref:STAS domain-containing protein n=1 Tax=Planococcus sp. CPCC 101016 TaxID=2599617 RepID=UPI0011B5E7AB|nr:STAS domain-containing protein [Planococcus sp. CPCC 101016]TWT07208.1 STAS domain-containing protein [Planococcus sp. CPCC 101016]